jgi:hypothetical protein
MSKVIHLDEYRIKKDLNDVRDLIKKARHMVSIGIEIPENTLGDLLLWESQLERKLEELISD